MQRIKKFLKSKFLRLYYLLERTRFKVKYYLISDKKYVNEKFKKNFGVYPNLINPARYNEYISKILLEYNDFAAVSCADKYEVRKYVENKGLYNILNDIYGIYYKVRDFEKDLSRLPDRFVIKATHGCEWNFICRNKKEIDNKRLRITLNHWLKSNFYYYQRENIYKNLKPRLICEKYLEDETGQLTDYKIHCFNGKPEFINVIKDRTAKMVLNTYDLDWNFIDVNFSRHYPNNKNIVFKKPEVFDELIEYSKILSADFNYVRVDFYIVNKNIIFGELTFTPGNGSYEFSEEEDIKFGEYFKN